MSGAERILVIKLGALGDFVQALGPFAAIRRHHGAAHITLLTTAPFEELARQSGYFDAVLLDRRPRWWQVAGWLRLRARLRASRFTRVYDVQTSGRSSAYFQLLRPGRRPEWSGIAKGCSHPHDNPGRDAMHSLDRQAEQLRLAGIAEVPPADLGWAEAEVSRFHLGSRYVLLVPGGARHRPKKRWPADRYAGLARRLIERGVEPVLIGGADQQALLAGIAGAAPGCRDLAGLTSHAEVAVLARGAAGAVGNDTGPMHLIAAAGCPSLVLFSDASDPALCAQAGPAVRILQHPDLAGLGVDQVEAALTLRD
ncbi:MAG: glycosyltransferase family 9 protein [Kiloniellales bacterium]